MSETFYQPSNDGWQSSSSLGQAADEISGVRPYGISLLIAGWDSHRGQSLYQVDPSGSYWAWKASAIGKNMVNGKTFLEKRCVDPSAMFSSRAQCSPVAPRLARITKLKVGC